MDYLFYILVMASLYVILATSYNLLIGFAGLFALAQAAFFGVGAYATAILSKTYGVPFPLPLLGSILFTALLGIIISLPAIRISGDYLVVVTLALQIVVVAVMQNWRGLTGGTDGISGIPPISVFGIPLDTPQRFLPFSLVVAGICFWVAWWIGTSPFGRALRAMRENESAALAVGKNVVAMKLTIFGISAALASVAGSLFAQYISVVSSESFTIDVTVYVLAMVVIGGIGNLWGSVAGATILTVLPELLKFVALPPDAADKIRQILYGLVLILILLARPTGLIGEQSVFRPRGRKSSLPQIPKMAVADVPSAAFGSVALVGKSLSKRFGGIRAVTDLDIELRVGQVTGLIGPNGAGKTTAFNLLTGFLRPDQGEVTLAGRSISGLRPYQLVHTGIARSFQDLRLFTRMSVLDNVLVSLPNQRGDNLLAVFFTPWLVRRERRENLLKALSILEFVGLVDRLEELADNLGYAEEKLLVVARLLATGAEVMLFDEPLSGLDSSTLNEIIPVIRRLAEAGKTVCIIEHNLDAIRRLCDWVMFLDEGRMIAQGKPEALMSDPLLAERYFG